MGTGSVSYEHLLSEVTGGVAYITLNRPDVNNALSQELLDELEHAISAADSDEAVRVVVIKGEGKSFCAGYDLSPQPGQPQRIDGPAWESLHPTIYYLRRNGSWWLRLLWDLRKPVVAQVHGYCLAGGNDLASACDLIIAADDAQFGFPQQRGLGLPHLAYAVLPFTIGPRRTRELAYTGDTICGSEAERIGMINRAVPRDQLDAEVTRLAERIALMPLEILSASKWCINHVFEITGIDAMARTNSEWDAIAIHNPRGAEFARIAAEHGLKAALTFRDAPWKDYAPGKGRTPAG